MPKYALETIAAQVTAPGAVGTAMVAVPGDSLRIRDSKMAALLDVVGFRQAAGQVRITSPLLHDNVVGLSILEGAAKTWLQMRKPQMLTPQDTLTLTAIGSAVAGDIESNALQIYYEDLAGIDGALITSTELRARSIEWFSPRVSITTGTAGGWSGTVAITALDDQLKANQEYAWVGVTDNATNANVGMIGMVSPDWGNLRIAVPLRTTVVELTSSYLMDLGDRSGLACIPVFNASQKSNVILTALGNENAATVVVSLLLARLGPGGSGRQRR